MTDKMMFDSHKIVMNDTENILNECQQNFIVAWKLKHTIARTNPIVYFKGKFDSMRLYHYAKSTSDCIKQETENRVI